MTSAKGFLTLLKRATRSKYQTLLMSNRLLMQCFDLDVDSDVGLHYILPIPDTEEYQSEFYDQTVLLNLPDIIKNYNMAHKEVDAYRKANKYKPKDLVEEVYLVENELKIAFRVADQSMCTLSIPVIRPTDIDHDVMNIMKQYNLLLDRIKPGGICMEIDGVYQGLQERINSTPEIYYYVLKNAGMKIRVPLFRSMFLGIKEVDLFKFNVQETLMTDVYIMTYQIAKNGIEEIFWGYIVNC
ncbi:MAG: hypothetical protein NC114_06475 [Ruminococcus flavefaciens]|nr:hypothetical protein [Ruminococcus flavefaciens]